MPKPSRFSARRKKRGVSTIIGTLIFLLILVTAFYTFATIFGDYNSYTQQLAKSSEQAQANSETQIALGNFTFGAPASNVTAANSSNSTDSFQRKTMYGLGLWWVFYSNGTSLDYLTSPDGASWSSPIAVTSSPGSGDGYNFALWQSGNLVYYVLTGEPSAFLWRYGALQSSGNISWSIPETSVSTPGAADSYPSVAMDSSGNVWVAVNANNGSGFSVIVWKMAAGAWSRVNDIASVQSDTVPILVPLSAGVCLIYGEGALTSTVDVTTTVNGGAWTAAVSPASYYSLFESSAVSIGNTVFFAGLASINQGENIGTVVSWSYSGAAISAETTLNATVASWSASVSETGGTVAAYYASGRFAYMQYTFGPSWYPGFALTSSETNASAISSPYSGPGSTWLSANASPEIRFASPATLVAKNDSPFAVHTVSLYVYNPSTQALVHYDTNSTAAGVSGAFDYWLGAGETLTIPLHSFGFLPGESYLLTMTTDQGVLASASFSAPN